MSKTYCPDCDAVVSVDSPRVGAMIKCRECGAELEVISTDPFEVDYPFDDDWDDDYEEDEEHEDETDTD
jgi:alpha-aminoadipate carrier protein LysW